MSVNPQMSAEGQRIAIAEACGWKHYGCTGCASTPCVCDEWINPSAYEGPTHLPDYLGSLDDMHDAEKVLTAEQCEAYNLALSESEPTEHAHECDGWGFHASAGRRAEHFLRTVNRWEVST